MRNFGKKKKGFEKKKEKEEIRGKRIEWIGKWGGEYKCEEGIMESWEKGIEVMREIGEEIVKIEKNFY